MKTLGAVLTAVGEPLEILELTVPSLLAGQVLVELRYSGICGTQLGEVSGSRGPDAWIPHCLGHEGSGVVLDVGPQVTKVTSGDLVVLSWIAGEGVPTGGAQYGSPVGEVNSGPVATLLRHAVVGESRLTKMPEGLTLRSAVALGCPAPTGLGAVANVLRPHAGDSMVVFGAGGVGLFSITAGAASGVSPIVCVDPLPQRRELAVKWGATHTLDPGDTDYPTQLREIVGPHADSAIDATGSPAVLAQAIDSVRPRGGRVVVVGNAPYGSRISVDPIAFNQGKSVLGTWGGDADPGRDFAWMSKVIADNAELVEGLYSQAFCLGDTNEAIRAMTRGAVGRALVDLSLE